MTSSTSACATGCTQRGKHLTTCTGRCQGCRRSVERPHTKQCDDKARTAAKGRATVPVGAELDPIRPPCTGCLPRPAEFGRLCAWCWQRLNADVVDAPALARYLWVVGHAGKSSAPADDGGGGGGGSDPRTRSVIHPAVDALDGLHSCLASWVLVILDEHPEGRRMTGPDDTGVRRTRSTKQLDHATFPHLPDEPSVWIRPSEVAGVHDPQATANLVRWLLPHLAWCASRPWVGEMRDEVASVVRTTAAAFPVDERTRAIPGVTCPNCNHVSLVFDPPTQERHSTQVNCSTRGCGVIYSEDDFKRLTRIVEWEQKNPEAKA